MIKELFRVGYGLKNILLTLLLCMTLVFLPSGEMIGFGTLLSAIPRYFFGIFTPLIIVFYYKYNECVFFGKKVPEIIILGIISGILINIHPPSALTVYLLIFIHWFFYRSGIADGLKGNLFKALKISVVSISLFLLLSTIYALPYVKYYYFSPVQKTPVVSAGLNESQKENQTFNKKDETLLYKDKNLFESSQKILGNLTRFEARTDFNMENTMFCLRQVSFIPFILPFLFLVFIFRKKSTKDFPESDVFDFLRTLFITGFIVASLGVFVSINFYFGPYFNAFRRTDRILFVLFELLALYFILFGKDMIKQKVWRYLLCTGLVFYWILLSKSKGMFQYDIILRHVPFISSLNLEERTLAINMIFFICVLGIIFLRWIKMLQEKVFKTALYFTISLLFFLWPVLSGGTILLTNHIFNSFNGIGAWALIEKIGLSKGHSKISDFENVGEWVRNNTPAKARFVFLNEPKAHNMKLLCKRSGIGALEEVGVDSVVDQKVKMLFNNNNFDEDVMRLANEYNLEYILTDNEYGLQRLINKDKFKIEYSGKYYSVLKIIRESSNEKI